MARNKRSMESKGIGNPVGSSSKNPIPNIRAHRGSYLIFHTHICKQCVVLDSNIARKAPKCYTDKCKKPRHVPCKLHKKAKHTQTTKSLEARKKLIKRIHKARLKKGDKDGNTSRNS